MFRGKELKENGLFSTTVEYHVKREYINDSWMRLPCPEFELVEGQELSIK
jgi:hypothetical protein